MDRQSRRAARGAELMGDDIVGNFLSNDVLYDSSKNTGYRQPQLWRFAHDQEDICNPRLLGSGEHGVAVLAVIKDVEYVLKVFKKWKQPGPVFSPYEEALYTSPLAHESRAFARLKSINEDGTWATSCHGWMKLSDAQFKKIEAVVSGCDLSRWVIIKNYIAESTNASHVQEIHTKFKIAEKARILPRDVQIKNYRGSRIVDLSSALTDPCPEWSEYWFRHFYNETVYGVFDWFDTQQSRPPWPASQFLLLAGTFIVVLGGSLIRYRTKLR